jgi:quinoprotein glucose dehydrogenase
MTGLVVPALGQRDWPTYGHDPGSSHYSPLKQIDTTNVSKLTRAWTFHMKAATDPSAPPPAAPPEGGRGGRGGRGGGGGGGRVETTPIVAGGLMYFPTPNGKVVALEPETGKQIWIADLGGTNASTRGLEYWAGDSQSPASLFFGTYDGRLMALNAKTGKPVPGFGNNGSVNMKTVDVNNGAPDASFSLSSPVKVYKNVIITGARVQEGPRVGYAGDDRGWDVHTGKLLWQFHSIPRPGEFGNDTWSADSWQGRSGVNVWGLFSLDPELGLVYLPHGSPAPDFFGGDRPGANLYGNSLVALDALTGKRKWHFQAIHHDIYDFDLEAAPILFDMTRNGRKIPALALTSKTGLVFILDRGDGKPLYDIEERTVPESSVPGEVSWPTQPWPVKPAPLGRMSFNYPDEIAKVTSEHEAFCRDLYEKNEMHGGGPFTPYDLKTTIQFPGTLGATNWHGGSYDPTLGYLFFNVLYLADVAKMIQPTGNNIAPWIRNSFARFWNPENYWPCQEPPWGQMVAINVNTGEYAWRVPLGIVEELEAKGVKGTGAMNMGGSFATAGGLVFIAATNDRHFRAFESKTGKVLWDVKMEAGAYATPITYQGKDGKQYVAIIAAGGGYYDRLPGDSVIAFALPSIEENRR